MASQIGRSRRLSMSNMSRGLSIVLGLPCRAQVAAEEAVGFDGGPVKHRDPALPEDQRQVELLVLVFGGLVNGADDGLAGRLREIAQQLNQRGGVVGGKPARGFVQKQDHRIGDQLHRDVHAFSLPARQDFPLRPADLEVRHALETELGERRRNPPFDLGFRVVGGQPELRAVAHGLVDRELRMHDIVLRHVADRAAQRIVDRIDVLAVDPHLAGRRRQVAVQREEQRGLARAGGAHERDQVTGHRLEAHVLEQRLHLTGLVAIGDLHDQIPRFDLVERPARPFRRVLDDDRDLLGLDLNQERHRPDEDLFAARDRDSSVPAGCAARARGCRSSCRSPRERSRGPLDRAARVCSRPAGGRRRCRFRGCDRCS